MFQPVDGNVNFPQQELAVGKFWKARKIYDQSLAQRSQAPSFVFYEGPPTANGMPHPGHCLTRAIKDLFPRYKTMRGYRCERKAGWDTHGLPVEVEVCKELGIHSKEEIEAYGVEPFIHMCQQSVWRYMREWERLTERLGFWIHLDEAYVTYHESYVESVWWSLKNLFDRGLLYQGHKIVWWWAQGGTALSAGEVGQGYRQVTDPSVYVKFPLLDKAGKVTDTSLLVWTTTPWTLPSNQFAAVNPDLEYSVVVDHHDGTTTQRLIIASALVETIAAKVKREFTVEKSLSGGELLGHRYRPPFECYYETLAEAAGILKGSPDEYADPDDIDETEHLYWRVVGADFVTTDSGTGVVHQAPAFGDVDFDVLVAERDRFRPIALKDVTAQGTRFQALNRPELLCAVGPDGKFTAEAPQFEGRWVKDCDKDIIRDLKQRGLLYHQEQCVHDYPFCWRAEEDPLIQYPRESWFIRTTEFKDQLLANNAKINWLPEHIQEGRFGNFLESNVDWALSRERYWGTPLPIWKCEQSGEMEAVANYDELLTKPGVRGTEVWDAAKKKNPELPDDLKVHKPYIDAITYDSPFTQGARMRRVPEVIDCWYDSGAMPFAQWGYPNTPGSDKQFQSQFPADFISEAIDQTRGWFYSQLAISTLLFGKEQGAGSTEQEASELPAPRSLLHAPYPHPFRNCIVLGLMLGEDGQKMSKSKRNYREPNEVFDRYGADTLRWYFFANQPPWTSIRYSEQAIKDSIPEFLLRLWNVYSFFVIYANIDGFDPAKEAGSRPASRVPRQGAGSKELDAAAFASAKSYRPIAERSELDRWILSELNRTAAAVVERMDAYDNFAACQHLTEFVDALSNWYVRRSRDRFWAADKRSVEKLDAYWTLYECLVTTARLIAPFVPFLAETLWQNLAGVFGQGANRSGVAESVHLCGYPTGVADAVDAALSERMNLVREIASLGRNARNAASLKVRQPLAKVEVVLADTTHQKWLEEHAGLIAEELNVKAVEYTTHGEEYIGYSVVPNFKRLGPRLGKNMPAAKKLLGEIDAVKLLADLKSAGKVQLRFPDGTSTELDNEDIEVRLAAKEGWAAAQGKACVVVLATDLTPELIAEGLARDVIRLIQDQRKAIGCEYTDRIEIGLATNSQELADAIEHFRDYITQETLAIKIVDRPLPGVESVCINVSGNELAIYVQAVK
ncbi:MAG: isoleucine--tRNA ligase [Planctomycetes bacterium]|nr:isoleucine--tRNA ligase [Planctomycetota bacterium]